MKEIEPAIPPVDVVTCPTCDTVTRVDSTLVAIVADLGGTLSVTCPVDGTDVVIVDPEPAAI